MKYIGYNRVYIITAQYGVFLSPKRRGNSTEARVDLHFGKCIQCGCSNRLCRFGAGCSVLLLFPVRKIRWYRPRETQTDRQTDREQESERKSEREHA